MRYLYKFGFDCGRMGYLDGLFVATEEEVENIIGQTAYFGEVLGKRSEVFGEIEEKDITKIDLDTETVEKVTKILGPNWSGFNPLDYVREVCSICGYSYDKEELYNCENGHKNICYSCLDDFELNEKDQLKKEFCPVCQEGKNEKSI